MAKPIIDILVGISNQNQLDKVVAPLISNNYIFYKKYNSIMPFRRFFVKLKKSSENIFRPPIYNEKDVIPNEINNHKLAHIHILEYNSFHWKRHIAFRNYLQEHSDIKNEYQELKIHLSTKEWLDGNQYNSAKNDFIRQIEEKAIEWYLLQNSRSNEE